MTRRTWLQEERRRTLGDWVALCPACGHAQRYFEGDEDGVSPSCPTCGDLMLLACAGCGARIPSVFSVDCEDCGAPLRAATGFGVSIRRRDRQA